MQVPTMLCSTHNEQLQGRQPRRKQLDLWHAVKCGLRIKAWEAREIQLQALGAKRECQSEWTAQVELDRIDDDAIDERDKEVMCACYFPQARPTRRNRPFDEEEAMVVLDTMEKYIERSESTQVDVSELEHFVDGPEDAGISVMSFAENAMDEGGCSRFVLSDTPRGR